MGGYFDYCGGFSMHLPVTMILMICGTCWRSHRSRGDEAMFANGTLAVFKQQLWLRLWPWRCLVVADESFGLTFLCVLGATGAQVSYFVWSGGSPDGRGLFVYGVLFGSTEVGAIKGGYRSSDH